MIMRIAESKTMTATELNARRLMCLEKERKRIAEIHEVLVKDHIELYRALLRTVK